MTERGSALREAVLHAGDPLGVVRRQSPERVKNADLKRLRRRIEELEGELRESEASVPWGVYQAATEHIAALRALAADAQARLLALEAERAAWEVQRVQLMQMLGGLQERPVVVLAPYAEPAPAFDPGAVADGVFARHTRAPTSGPGPALACALGSVIVALATSTFARSPAARFAGYAAAAGLAVAALSGLLEK